MTSRERETGIGGPDVRFRDTLWSAVLRARDRGAPGAREALDQLIRAYWKPVYFFVRRRGARIEEAKDLTQGFFAEMLERDFLKGVDPARGKFRTFLLTALTRWLANERDRAMASKRGGGRTIVPLDHALAEREIAAAGAAGEAPGEAFERAWAATVLARAFERLRGHRHYDALALHLTEGLGATEIARRTGRAPKDVENALYRARRRFREVVLGEIRQYVATEPEAEEELGYLLGRFAKGK